MATPIPDDIALLSGPPLLGHLFNYGLFGILSAQVVHYHLSFSSDPFRLKAFIYGLYLVEWVQVILITHDAFQVYGAGWGNFAALNSPQWLWFDIPVMTALVSATVQCFFAWRIYALSGSRIISVFVVLVALMQAGGGVATGIQVGPLLNNNALIQQTAETGLIIWLGGSAACDIIIACSMSFLLLRQRRGLASDKLLSRIITLSVETGIVTASFATLDLTLCMVFKHNNLHMLPAFMLSKLYTNSLMLTFNNRTRLRGDRNEAQVVRSDGTWGATSSSRARAGAAPQEISLPKLPVKATPARQGNAHTQEFEMDLCKPPRVTGDFESV